MNTIKSEISLLKENSKNLGRLEKKSIDKFISENSISIIVDFSEEQIQFIKENESGIFVIINYNNNEVSIFKNEVDAETAISELLADNDESIEFKSYDEYQENYILKNPNHLSPEECVTSLALLLNKEEKAFDFSIKSIELLDEIVDNYDPGKLDLEDYIFLFGQYISESIVKNNLGSWVLNKTDIRFKEVKITEKNKKIDIYFDIYKYLTKEYGEVIYPSFVLNFLK